MNNCGKAQKKFIVSFPRDCHTYARNDKFFSVAPERKLIRSVLIKELCNLKDGTSSRNGGEPLRAELDD